MYGGGRTVRWVGDFSLMWINSGWRASAHNDVPEFPEPRFQDLAKWLLRRAVQELKLACKVVWGLPKRNPVGFQYCRTNHKVEG